MNVSIARHAARPRPGCVRPPFPARSRASARTEQGAFMQRRSQPRAPRLLALVLWAAMAPAAWAQGAGAAQACHTDATQLCPGVQPGGGRVLACLKQHEAELSSGCKAALPRIAQCAAQVQQVCGNGGSREMRSCLKAHRDELSAACPAGATRG